MTRVITPLRYPGGKAKALKKIMPLINTDYLEFREPFVGGGSIFIAAKQDISKNATYKISDLNYDLVCFWNTLKTNPDELIADITQVKENITNGYELYKDLKENKLYKQNERSRALRFYLLNRITYSGLVDSGGYSNASFHKRFTHSIIDRLNPLSKLLKNVIIEYGSYEKLLYEKGKKVFLYLDPPYLNAKSSKLYGVKGDLHKNFDHNKFAEDVINCPHTWLITCDDTKEMRHLFDFAYMYEWKLKYGMTNVNGRKVKHGKELCITNYDIDNIDNKTQEKIIKYLLTPVQTKLKKNTRTKKTIIKTNQIIATFTPVINKG